MSHRKMRMTWRNCESLRQSKSQSYESLLADLQITFQMVSQKDLFFVLSIILDKIYTFLDTFYVYDTKIRIRCE